MLQAEIFYFFNTVFVPAVTPMTSIVSCSARLMLTGAERWFGTQRVWRIGSVTRGEVAYGFSHAWRSGVSVQSRVAKNAWEITSRCGFNRTRSARVVDVRKEREPVEVERSGNQ